MLKLSSVMKRLYLAIILCLLAISPLFANTEDTVVFRTRMLPDNLVPPLAAAGNSALATITIRTMRDGRGNISFASVTFDIDYTLTEPRTFNGLHIHRAATGVNDPVAIDAGALNLSGCCPLFIVVVAGSGRFSFSTGVSSAAGLSALRGFLATPENYYVDIHCRNIDCTGPKGDRFMRGQFPATLHLVLRPVLSPTFEVPAVPIDAEGAALIDIRGNRDDNGAITSGIGVFDVNYRFPIGTTVTVTGMHLHNARFGASGPVVIDSGLNSTTRAVTVAGGTGNIFRIAEIPSTDMAGIAAFTDLIADPTQFY